MRREVYCFIPEDPIWEEITNLSEVCDQIREMQEIINSLVPMITKTTENLKKLIIDSEIREVYLSDE